MIRASLESRGLHWALQALLGALLLGGLGPQVLAMEGMLPLSLQSLLVCWIPLMVGWRSGTLAVLMYLMAGALGLPVFAGNQAGLDVIAGPTGGYLLGFPLVAFALGMAADTGAQLPLRQRYLLAGAGMLLGHGLILALGIPWQMQFVPDLDTSALLDRLSQPVILKSALGLLLSVIAIRSVEGQV